MTTWREAAHEARPTDIYPRASRALHWAVAALVLATLPVGFIMARRAEANLFDGVTNVLYSTHKLVGFVILLLMVARIANRLLRGAPPPAPSLTAIQRIVSGAVHSALYVLLVAVPVLGWVGVSLYPALDIFGLFSLPALTSPDKAAAERVFRWHAWAAFTVAGLAALHIAAALAHRFAFKDGVFERMWPRRV